MKITIKNAPLSKLGDVMALVINHIENRPDQKIGMYNAACYGFGQKENWQQTWYIWRTKTGFVLKYVGEGALP